MIDKFFHRIILLDTIFFNVKFNHFYRLIMRMVKLSDFLKTCRLCAKAYRHEKLVKIFSGRGISLNLRDSVNKHLPIKVTEIDAMPKNVCINCIRRLNATNEFLDTILTSDKCFKRLLTKVNCFMYFHLNIIRNILLSVFKFTLSIFSRKSDRGLPCPRMKKKLIVWKIQSQRQMTKLMICRGPVKT